MILLAENLVVGPRRNCSWKYSKYTDCCLWWVHALAPSSLSGYICFLQEYNIEYVSNIFAYTCHIKFYCDNNHKLLLCHFLPSETWFIVTDNTGIVSFLSSVLEFTSSFTLDGFRLGASYLGFTQSFTEQLSLPEFSKERSVVIQWITVVYWCIDVIDVVKHNKMF